MRTFFFFSISICFTLSAYAQYPFEKKPAIKYKQYIAWKVKEADHSIEIPKFYRGNQSLTLQITSVKDSSIIKMYNANKLLQTFTEPYVVGEEAGPAPQSVFIEDVNGDGLKDIKILIPNNGCCGSYNYYLHVIYLFQQRNGTFTKISFSDLMMEYVNRIERDFDGDGNFEIITQTFQSHGNHNYWVFNLYNFNGRELVNVNHKANYPILVQLLYGNNYKITDKITRAKMKQYARKLPDEYDKK